MVLMFNRHSVTLSKDIHEKATTLAAQRGYSGLAEFVEHLLRGELEKEAPKPGDQEKLKERLKGLGYL
jgi:metal-responsive CopG/Arc/MetJ family transcriptional regulator